MIKAELKYGREDKGGFTAQSFRHNFISSLAERGLPRETIMELSGRTSIQGIEPYLHATPESIKQASQLITGGDDFLTGEGVNGVAQVTGVTQSDAPKPMNKLQLAPAQKGLAVTETLSYNKYLRVPDLIALQDCLSEPVHHDELLFITIHQTYELWFKQILHEIDAAIAQMNEDRGAAAARALHRVAEIEKVLVQQIHLLETMTPINFLGFRDELNPASGFQSMQFREIEFSSGLKDKGTLQNFRDDEFAFKRLETRINAPSLSDAFFAYLRRRGFDAPADDASLSEEERRRLYGKRTNAILEVITHFESRYEEFQLAESLIEHDELFSLWRFHHVKMVERMVGTKKGTGGSEGVGYLRTTLDSKFFPELWEARTYLDTKHGEGGCPFAGS